MQKITEAIEYLNALNNINYNIEEGFSETIYVFLNRKQQIKLAFKIFFQAILKK